MNQEEYQSVLEKYRVPVSNLRPEFPAEKLPFETTDDIECLPNIMIGQERAEKAMDFGLSVDQSGYNLFVVGSAGTGKKTYTKNRVLEIAKTRPVPNDWCYVYNFENPDRPMVISLPAGEGIKFQRKIENLLIDIERGIRSCFSDESFEKRKQMIIEEFRTQAEELWKKADEFAQELNYKIERTPASINAIPLRFGRPMSKEEFDRLTEPFRSLLLEKEKKVEEKIRETVYHMGKMEEKLRKNLDDFMRESAMQAIEGLFIPLKEEYKNNLKVLSYLQAYFRDVVDHFSFFLDEKEDENNIMSALMAGSKEQLYHRYTVNLLVNNRNLTGAPVIYETNPTYHNLFGKIEYRGEFGNWVTDFTYIKPGALHLANGGYLILQAQDLLQQPYSWNLLKRALQTGNIQIENHPGDRSIFPSSAIKPEPIPLNIKVIIIGSYYLYDLLAAVDEDFHKLFKVKVEFNTVMNKNEENTLKMARFVKRYADEEGLLPFHKRAVAKVIDYSSRLVEDQSKLSTRFQEITKVLVESSYWAKKAGDHVVDDHHIDQAISEQIYRSNHVAEMYREMIQKGTIMVETDGYRVGQINGLAVIGTRNALFGIPTKITAQTFVGKSGIMNVEREASLSGQIHNKGLMILTGFLSGVFAKNQPIPLSASITFEQTYTGIDGDSASSTELYVLLSSLANVPINQGIAVTGSVNQWGEIQPIGGVNEKIEGFYHICKLKGLTGNQGVIIPKQNVENLMLEKEVVEAVKNGQFHIWQVSHIAEGIEILTGVKAGNIRGEDGRFPSGTIFGKVEERFRKMYEAAKKTE